MPPDRVRTQRAISLSEFGKQRGEFAQLAALGVDIATVSQAMFKALLKNRLLYTDKQLQWFSPTQNRFLPDRYVEGTCPHCGKRQRHL